MESEFALLSQRYAEVQERIATAATKAGRQPEEVRLVAVSKTHPASTVGAALDAGMHVFGENRPQELAVKAAEYPQAHWCAIGGLQRNKAKLIAEFADEFQALDSIKVARALNNRLDDFGRTLDVFVQVNTSAEPQKGGTTPAELPTFLTELLPFQRLRVRGLMTMAANTTDEGAIRRSFATLRELAATTEAPDGMSLDDLSMGMSGDFELAIAEGATTVRVGSAIFGHRDYNA
ncbi:MAG: YggS family pyridoxal phosphate-dependent enzyme [Corynebacterium sp.]|nr:YggS family pyridoxal phosphate-dependent enzyme [Corynebacterium sp.]